jgi:peptidoglycan/xylan/chitin deacetylase (PgdA/CDA1 family)
MKTILRILCLVTLSLLAACGVFPALDLASPTPTITSTPLPPTLTPTATVTLSPLPPTLTPIPTWASQPAGEVTCPILLYHQIADLAGQYYVSPADFTVQMEALRDWGYTPIPISLLVKAITQGADLPSRPVVITFDDGDQNVYASAFPVMRDLGFPGVIYIIDSAVDSPDHLTRDEILEMVAAGWEVGDHSMSHINLMNNHDQVWTEASLSRTRLQEKLGIFAETFAYPYGAADTFVMEKISKYGYSAAVGLGTTAVQGPENLFYLSRIEVPNSVTLDQFAALLPWSGLQP